MFKVPEHYRVKTGKYASTEAEGNNGMFVIPTNSKKYIYALAKEINGYEILSIHVSDHLKAIKGQPLVVTPSHDILKQMRDLFWGQEDRVVQIHFPLPERANFYNSNVIVLYRPKERSLPAPPAALFFKGGKETEENDYSTDFVNKLRSSHDVYSEFSQNIAKIIENVFLLHRENSGKRTLSLSDITELSHAAGAEITDTFANS